LLSPEKKKGMHLFSLSVEDLKVLTGHIAALRQAGFDARIPHTEALLLDV
jgi:hypothetical protein